jgi:hypothetical protein
MEFPQNKFLNYLISKKRNNKLNEITGMKNFPTYFFITFILIVSVLSFKFFPSFVGFANNNYKYEDFSSNRHSIRYFSDYFKELDVISKVILEFIKIILDNFINFPDITPHNILLSKFNIFKKFTHNRNEF